MNEKIRQASSGFSISTTLIWLVLLIVGYLLGGVNGLLYTLVVGLAVVTALVPFGGVWIWMYINNILVDALHITGMGFWVISSIYFVEAILLCGFTSIVTIALVIAALT